LKKIVIIGGRGNGMVIASTIEDCKLAGEAKECVGFLNDNESKIRKREKQDFSAPDESRYRGENAEYIKELLFNSRTVSNEFINKKYLEKIINEHLNHHMNHRLLIWSFMNFEWWCRIFLNGERVNE